MSSIQNIRFCKFCDNKYYHYIDNDELVYICRVCGDKDNLELNKNTCVLDLQYNTDGTKPFEYIVNKYTKFDPTLPHINIPCPNDKCNTNTNKNKDTDATTDAVYLRYDESAMKHLYLCTKCDHLWKTFDKNKN